MNVVIDSAAAASSIVFDRSNGFDGMLQKVTRSMGDRPAYRDAKFLESVPHPGFVEVDG